MKNDDGDWQLLVVMVAVGIFAIVYEIVWPATPEEIEAREITYQNWADAHPYCAAHPHDICTDSLLDSASMMFNALLPVFAGMLIIGTVLSVAYWFWKKRSSSPPPPL